MNHHIPDSSGLTGWRKASSSDPQGGNCVEVLDGYPDGVPVRDSKALKGSALVFSTAARPTFVTDVKTGAFGGAA